MTTETTPPPSHVLYPPGGLLIWSLVLMEVLTFGVALIAFMISGRSEPEVFQAGRQHLQPLFGVANTGFLLISGYFMAQAVERFKSGANARPFVRIAMLGGLLFLILKGIEYNGKVAAGFTIEHDTFFTYYWLLTVFHVLHVLVGLIFLTILQHRLRPGAKPPASEDFEASAVFWHMCDLIWLVLFPVIYLLP